MVSFTFFGFALSRSSTNRLVVVCSEQCLEDDASMDCIYLSFSRSRSGMPLLLLSISLLLLLSFYFCSLLSSLMALYLSFLSSFFRWFAVLLAHLKCKLGNMGLSCFFLPKAVVSCIFRKVQLIVCIVLLLENELKIHVVTPVLQLNTKKKNHIWERKMYKHHI